MKIQVKYGGKRGQTLNLVESPDLVAIRTEGNKALEDADLSPHNTAMLSDADTVVAFPEAGVTVKRIPKSDQPESGPTAARDAARETLKQEAGIRFAGRVLTDAKTGAPMLYTENFFVKFHDNVAEADCLALLAKYALSVKNQVVFAKNSYFAEAAEGTGQAVFGIAEQLLAEKQVEFCHPEIVSERRFKTIHPLQWHLVKTEINGKTIDQHCNIEAAWKISKGKGVTVAVIDDGVDIDHPEFKGRVVFPRDVTKNSDDPRPKENSDKHGTCCAGVACGAGLDGGASGTAPEAKLMPIRCANGLGSMAEANAFAWAADHGADVISCSWGPPDGEWYNPKDKLHSARTPLFDSTRLAIEYALTKGRNGRGSVVLFAAGNGNEDTQFDGYASNPAVIAVAACNDRGSRSVYSDFGETVWVAFPSNDFGYSKFKHPEPLTSGIRTVDRVDTKGYTLEDYNNSFGGTSSACPGTAGVVALMLAANPNLSPTEVKAILKNSTQKIDPENGGYDVSGHSTLYGYGRVDAGLAVANAQKFAGAGVSLEGSARFVSVGEVQLRAGEMAGNFNPPKKALGLSLRLKSAPNGLTIKYKANVSGLGIEQNQAEGEYVGADNGRRNLLGFAAELQGAGAADFDLKYSARLRDLPSVVSAKNGAFCGTDKKSGAAIEGIAISLEKKG